MLFSFTSFCSLFVVLAPITGSKKSQICVLLVNSSMGRFIWSKQAFSQQILNFPCFKKTWSSWKDTHLFAHTWHFSDAWMQTLTPGCKLSPKFGITKELDACRPCICNLISTASVVMSRDCLGSQNGCLIQCIATCMVLSLIIINSFAYFKGYWLFPSTDTSNGILATDKDISL